MSASFAFRLAIVFGVNLTELIHDEVDCTRLFIKKEISHFSPSFIALILDKPAFGLENLLFEVLGQVQLDITKLVFIGFSRLIVGLAHLQLFNFLNFDLVSAIIKLHVLVRVDVVAVRLVKIFEFLCKSTCRQHVQLVSHLFNRAWLQILPVFIDAFFKRLAEEFLCFKFPHDFLGALSSVWKDGTFP